MTRLARYGPLAASLALLLGAAFALDAAALHIARGHLVYALDDSYIQMAIAKNLAAHGVWGVTRDAFSGAGSSLAWPLVLAAIDRGVGLGERAPFVLNLIAAVIVLVMADAWLRRQRTGAWLSAAALALLVLAVPLAFLPLVGMEHAWQSAAALALATAGVRSLTTADARERRAAFGWTLAAVVGAVALRYDTASVVVVVVTCFAWRREWARATALVMAAAVPVAAYAMVAARHGWPLVPSPVLMKQRLAGVHLFSWHGAADVMGGGALAALIHVPALFVLVAGALAQLAWRAVADDTRARERRLLLTVFVGATLVHLEFGRLGWLYRYEAYLMVLGIVANAAALGPRIAVAWPRGTAAESLAFAALVVIGLSPFALRGVNATRESLVDVDRLYRHEYQFAQFFRRYPVDGALLLNDIGLITFYADVPIVDAAGLATVELLGQGLQFDWDRVLSAARAHGARVSIAGDPGTRDEPWICVAEWQEPDETPSEATVFFAADRDEAAALDGHLRAFAADERSPLTFADAMTRPCPGPR
jgi:hypothetical protein